MALAVLLQLEEYGGKYQEQSWGSVLQLIGDPEQVPEIKGLNALKEKVHP